ncbi:hypothetical protein [Streptomyces sp. ADI91-18]|uniref:hypothetical protein n=1 Tax=Streptomyces sp. ADI91-18 TaxID=1522755 RepID=UPI000F55047C|nr:hypothetical protein [Streptomyces sp. ADI91-18]
MVEGGAQLGQLGAQQAGDLVGLAGEEVAGGGLEGPVDLFAQLVDLVEDSGEVVVVQCETAAVAEPHALGQSEGDLLGESVCDRVDGHETEVECDLVGVMAHGRVGSELAGQRCVGVDDRRPRRAAARA